MYPGARGAGQPLGPPGVAVPVNYTAQPQGAQQWWAPAPQQPPQYLQGQQPMYAQAPVASVTRQQGCQAQYPQQWQSGMGHQRQLPVGYNQQHGMGAQYHPNAQPQVALQRQQPVGYASQTQSGMGSYGQQQPVGYYQQQGVWPQQQQQQAMGYSVRQGVGAQYQAPGYSPSPQQQQQPGYAQSPQQQPGYAQSPQQQQPGYAQSPQQQQRGYAQSPQQGMAPPQQQQPQQYGYAPSPQHGCGQQQQHQYGYAQSPQHGMAHQQQQQPVYAPNPQYVCGPNQQQQAGCVANPGARIHAQQRPDLGNQQAARGRQHMRNEGRPCQALEIKLDDCRDHQEYFVKSEDYERDEHTLGSGAFGTVCVARHRLNGWTVALKKITGAASPEDCLNEIRTLRKCDDRFLLIMQGIGFKPFMIVTEYMPFGSLWDHRTELNSNQQTIIAIGIAHGMRYLHSRNIMHRDLKSPNILLDSWLWPKVADFGLSKIMTDRESENSEVGTLHWMAPEIFDSRQGYGLPVDVYAYGMILYEMLMERLPFSELAGPKGEHDAAAIRRAVLAGERPKIDLDPETAVDAIPIVSLIKDCWKQDPKERPSFETIYEMFESQTVAFPKTSGRAIRQFLRLVSKIDHSSINNMQKLSVSLVNDKDKQREGSEIWSAVSTGDIFEFSKQLLYMDDPDVMLRDGDGNSPLHIAAEHGQSSMVEFLFGVQGVDVNAGNNKGQTPLMLAVLKDYFHIVRIMLVHENCNVNVQDRMGNTALHLALEKENALISRELLACKDIDLNIQNSENKTPMDMTSNEVIQQLLEQVAKKSSHK